VAVRPRDMRSSAPPADRVRAEFRRVLDSGIAVATLLLVLMMADVAGVTSGIAGALQSALPLRQVVGIGVLALFWPVIFLAFGLYDDACRSSAGGETRRIVAACTVGTLVAAPLTLLPIGAPTSWYAVLAFWAIATVATAGARTSLRAVTAVQAQQQPRRRLIVGSGPRAQRLVMQFRGSGAAGGEVIGFVDSDAGSGLMRMGLTRIGGLPDLERILMRQVVDEVVVALPIKSCYTEIQQVIHVCERTGTQLRYLADIFDCTLARPSFDQAGEVPVVAMRVVYDDARQWVKRGVDIIGALVGIAVLSPLMLLIAAGIKLTSPGPALFTQERFGLNKRRFCMYKFRTMVADAEALQDELESFNEMSGAVFKIENDPRITPMGRFLRRSSLDELPQLFNVLTGKMSLVGPRPLPVRDVDRFAEPWLVRRFSVRPGLTCLWQVGGRNTLGFDDWMALDLHYIDSWSLWLDTQILLRTVPAVIRGTGAR
jgi:exopolysaccharide biosynthesis polyprenyl glycosylphosphotransferase